MSLQYCTDRSLSCVTHADMIWSVGQSIGITFYGGMLVLGIICLSSLSSAGKGVHRGVLRTYVIALLVGNTIQAITSFLWYYLPSIFILDSAKMNRAINILTFLGCLIPVFIAGLVDGLLAWRCYMVQRALETKRAKWQRVFWVFPLCLWLITTACAFVGAVLGNFQHLKPLSKLLQSIALGSNTFLNFFATFYIIIQLLMHRRLVKKYWARTVNISSDSASTKSAILAQTRHLHIAGILLQSAAVNIPITVTAAIGVALDMLFGTVAVYVAVACQSFASVLIIHQVAIGRTIDGQQESIGVEFSEVCSQ